MKKFSALFLALVVLGSGVAPAASAGEGTPPREDAVRPVSQRHIGSGVDAGGNPFYVLGVAWSDGTKTHEVMPGYFT